MRDPWQLLSRKWEYSMCSLPVVVGVLILLFQGWLTESLTLAIVPEAGAIQDERAFGTRFVLLSGAALVYSLICLVASLYYGLRLRAIRRRPDAPPASWTPVWLLVASSTLFFGCYFLFPEILSLSAVTLKPTLDLYNQSTDVTSAMGLRGVLLAAIPALFGGLAAIMSAAHAALATKGALASFCAEEDGSRRRVESALREVLNGMLVLSVALIGSVVLVTLHVHAHAPLLPDHLQGQYEQFASFVSVFWGLGLTVVAASTCMPQLGALLHLRRLGAVVTDPTRYETARSAMAERLEMALAIFGPFLIAFLGWVAERVLT